MWRKRTKLHQYLFFAHILVEKKSKLIHSQKDFLWKQFILCKLLMTSTSRKGIELKSIKSSKQ